MHHRLYATTGTVTSHLLRLGKQQQLEPVTSVSDDELRAIEFEHGNAGRTDFYIYREAPRYTVERDSARLSNGI